MTILKGIGISAVNYPTGMNLGGDPTQALVHILPSGAFQVVLGSVDLGQGLTTVIAQIAAETLGVPLDTVHVHIGDTDTGPHCMGTFASRTTHRAGNAVVMAAREARQALLEVAALELDEAVDSLDLDGDGNIHVHGSNRFISVADVALAAHFKHGRTVSGRGIYLKELSGVDPETGAMDPDSGHAHASCVAEVEVDSDTGIVRVVRVSQAFEIGRAVNPALIEQQIIGGTWMGLSHALYETTRPYYPSPEHAPDGFGSYLMPHAAEMPELRVVLLERPNPSGPFGVKGVGEMTQNPVIPAIASAVGDAIGAEIDSLPITPEKVLAALDRSAGTAA
jgi:CO/xanthine dehydrogenase Mo-binding subunit